MQFAVNVGIDYYFVFARLTPRNPLLVTCDPDHMNGNCEVIVVLAIEERYEPILQNK